MTHVTTHNIRLLAALGACACLVIGAIFASLANAAWSTGSFTADYSVSQPYGLTPNDDSGVVTFDYPGDPIELTFYAVAGAASYQLQIATSSSFDEPSIVVDTSVTSPAYVPTMTDPQSRSLYQSGTYWWRVRAIAPGGETGLWSVSESFRRTWTGTPTGLQFYDDAKVAASSTSLAGYFRWNAVPGAASYDLEVASAQSFAQGSIMLYVYGLKGNAVVMPQLPDDIYWWRVRAKDANGAAGSWVASSTSVQKSWTALDPTAAYPADGATLADMRVGWDPVPGASFYQVEAATSQSCFWDPGDTSTGGYFPYGDWVDDSHAPGAPSHCRLSERNCTTINNWLTAFADDELTGSVDETCMLDEAVVKSVIPSHPDVQAYDDAPAAFPTSFWWRVRPVAQVASSTESNWNVGSPSSVPPNTIYVYGDWMVTSNRPFQQTYDFQPPFVSAGTGCPAAFNTTGNACLVQVASRISSTNAGTGSSTMQTPVLVWSPFGPTHNGAAADPAGGYLVQIAADEDFTNIVKSVVIGGYLYGWVTSMSLTTGLPDNEQGTGYWWRVVPCDSDQPVTGVDVSPCVPFYDEQQQSEPPNSGAMTFTKRVDFGGSLTVTSNFAGAMPLLEWARIDGAMYYQLELCRNVFFIDDPADLSDCYVQDSSGDNSRKTGVRMIVPYVGTPPNLKELDEGTWYWRVRAVDRDGLKSGWSTTSSFNKRMAGPTLSSPSSGATVTIPFVRWQQVPGAERYEVQWASSSSFGGASSTTTAQTETILPAFPGAWYWRVRALSGTQSGAWSDARTITIVRDDTIEYSLSRTALAAGDSLYINGLLKVDGRAPSTPNTVSLQRNSGCTGSYATVDSKNTGTGGEEGTVRFKRTAGQIDCYRMKYTDTGGLPHYSAPFRALVRPKVVVKLSRTKIRRGRAIRIGVSLNRAISGRALFQIRKRGVWTTVKTVRVTRKKRFAFNAAVNVSGRFPSRLKLDSMGVYTVTYKSGPTLRVNDSWSIT